MSVELYLGDCLEGMPRLPSASVDLVLCDLPYGTTRNKWDAVVPFAELWREYERLSHGAAVLNGAQPFTSALIASNPAGFRYAWVWDKANPTGFLNAKKQPLRVTEDVLVFGRPRAYNPQMETRGAPRKKGGYTKPGGSDNYGAFDPVQTLSNEYYPTNLLRISNAARIGKEHPTQKPVALFQYLIKTYTNPGDTVLDNCMGSGTTGVACMNTGRNFIGIEKDSAYFAIARRRIAEAEAFAEKEVA